MTVKQRRRAMTDEQRFLGKVVVDPGSGCWTWTGYVDTSSGYGQFRVRERLWRAHRWAFDHWCGPIPDGLDVDHQCHNGDQTCAGGVTCVHRRCVNPSHLELATRSANLRAGRVVPPKITKLSPPQVEEIRSRYAAGGISTIKLGAEYGVASSTINNIVTGRSWKQQGPTSKGEPRARHC